MSPFIRNFDSERLFIILILKIRFSEYDVYYLCINFRPPEVITHMAVSNNQMVLVLRNKKLLRINLNQKSYSSQSQLCFIRISLIKLLKLFFHLEEDLSMYLGDKSHFAKLHQVYLSPSGKHCLLSCYFTETPQSAVINDNFYWHKKIRHLSKAKNHQITAVAWNFESESQNLDSTSYILLGTSKGLIFETELLAADDSQKWIPKGSGPEQYFKQVYSVGSDAGAVTAIEFHRASETNEKLHFILVTTKNRLYQFVGNVGNNLDAPIFANVFNTSSNQFQDVPGHLDFSKLDFYYTKSFQPPQTFGWLTEPGVLYGQLDMASIAAENKVTSDTVLIPYAKEPDIKFRHIPDNYNEEPISMILTRFHILVLFKKMLRVICLINEEIVMEDTFVETYGAVIGITKDIVKGTIWTFSETAIHKYKVIEEDRNIWEIYLKQNNFDMAKVYARNDPIKTDKIICEEADYYFRRKNYAKSASLYAISLKSFEEAALKFMQLGDQNALKEFLIYKFDTIPAQEETQITLLLLWLIEILMNQMSELSVKSSRESEDFMLLKAEFQSILSHKKVKQIIVTNSKAIYDLILSHGNEDCLIDFCKSINDYKVVIDMLINQRRWDEILDIFASQKNAHLFYTYSPILMKYVPRKLVEILMKQSKILNPSSLLPAFMQRSEDVIMQREQLMEMIRYLEHCVYEDRVKDTAIHNYLLALYAEVECEKLKRYLEMIISKDDVRFNLSYALRICKERELNRECVILYTIMGLYEEAVDLALSVDIDLAKKTARNPELDDDVRKKLWLKIAKHVVIQEKDIHQVTELLKECDILKIEDVLPYFPDFVTISHFKHAICSSLQEYNQHIESLKDEMKEATKRGQEIREDVKSLRNRYTMVKAEDQCCICDYALLTRAFYVFPCRHMFHSDCLASQLMPHLKPEDRKRLDEIEKLMLIPSQKIGNTENSPIKIANKEQLQNELDDIVSSECLFCGEIMIKSVDMPFIFPEESNSVLEGW
ncbi:hypothetical protein B4U80_08207 [Leptotrombidium deliense]|uniref:Vacuolar protein sorting-associated protein 18 homolog n=1 Tax=Leptotrombidium deliense TaxID=299467 RepID=A0A443SQJ1_9ACAR|nr:hypothetical protein B4U80_08207 [Leptotrombidium deliense]